MSTVLRMKQHDTAKPLTITCTDRVDGGVAVPVDLTTATAVKVIGTRNGSALFARTVTGTDEGVVVMPWQPADTATTGTLRVEIEVTWPDATIQTFPSSGYLSVYVEKDLG